MSIIEHKTYKHYPKYISTLILSDYISKQYNEDNGIYDFQIDDLLFKFQLIDNQIAECLVTKNTNYYDYFCRDYLEQTFKID